MGHRALLVVVFVAWATTWVVGNRPLLFDPLLQNDDARTHLIAFHRYEPGGTLADDPFTHVLVRDDRYGADFRAWATLFEPLGSFARALLAGVQQHDLVLAHPPREAIVFRDDTFTLLSVERLRAAWSEAR